MARDRRYSSARWQRLREQVIRRDGRRCAVPGCTSDMAQRGMVHVDHVVEVKDGGPFWSPDNLRVVCRHHHFEKSVGTIVSRATGSPSRRQLTPGDPTFCWRKQADGTWHHFNPLHNIGECQWPDCPHNAEYERWKERNGHEKAT